MSERYNSRPWAERIIQDGLRPLTGEDVAERRLAIVQTLVESACQEAVRAAEKAARKQEAVVDLFPEERP